MRLFFLLTLGLIVPQLTAQITTPANNSGWQISASFSPDLDKTIFAENLQSEIILENIPISQRPQITYDTVSIGGVNRLFSGGGFYGQRIKPSTSNSWYAANIKVHRRLGQFDFSGGLYYSSGAYTSTPTLASEATVGVVSTRALTLLYEVADVRSRSIGLETSMHYHLFQKSRLHPYLGGGVALLHNRTGREVKGRVHSDDLSLLLASPNTGPSQINNSFNLDLVVTFGVAYELTEQWSVALEANGQADFARGLVGFQVRRML